MPTDFILASSEDRKQRQWSRMTRSTNFQRSRIKLALATIIVIGLGLATRSSLVTQPFIQSHAGDALWALMIYLMIAFLFPKARTAFLIVGATTFCLVIELSQLSTHPWLVAGRENRFGALILGRGFLAIDLLRYAAGVLVGGLIDRVLGPRLLS